MITTALLLLAAIVTPVSKPAPAPKASCEVVGPSLSGTYYSICKGKVTQASDSMGNVHEAPFGF